MPNQNHRRNGIRRPFLSKFVKGYRFPKWPERTGEELECLRVSNPQTPPIPPRWLRIEPAQYLKERRQPLVVLYSNGRKTHPPIRLLLTAESSSSPLIGEGGE